MILTILFALAPFGAALFRARQTGDVRMGWMAVAGLAAAAVVVSVAKSRKPARVATATLLIATVAAGAAGIGFGGLPVGSVGLWMVAAVYGICFAISAAFLSKLRR